jgi:hypothetical protein
VCLLESGDNFIAEKHKQCFVLMTDVSGMSQLVATLSTQVRIHTGASCLNEYFAKLIGIRILIEIRIRILIEIPTAWFMQNLNNRSFAMVLFLFLLKFQQPGSCKI